MSLNRYTWEMVIKLVKILVSLCVRVVSAHLLVILHCDIGHFWHEFLNFFCRKLAGPDITLQGNLDPFALYSSKVSSFFDKLLCHSLIYWSISCIYIYI